MMPDISYYTSIVQFASFNAFLALALGLAWSDMSGLHSIHSLVRASHTWTRVIHNSPDQTRTEPAIRTAEYSGLNIPPPPLHFMGFTTS
jgi:hypothetical protein